MVKILKLVSGVELAGSVIQQSETEITVDKPLQINYRYFIGSVPTASFIRYCLFGEDTTTVILRSHVISQHIIRDSFLKVYENNADYYYGEHQEMIDRELEGMTAEQGSSQEEHLKKLLEMMPVDGAPVN